MVFVYLGKFVFELVWVVVEFGVELFEYIVVCGIEGDGISGGICFCIDYGSVVVDWVVFVMNVFFLFLKCNWLMIVLVYDYVLMMELLSLV